MDIKFEYDRNNDVWCLLNKGKGSNNSSKPTKVYEELVTTVGANPTELSTSNFIDDYLKRHDVNLDALISQYSDEWHAVSSPYHETAQQVFGDVLPDNVTAYLTINNRNPYNISENYFYVSAPRESVKKTVMHELWHFYTWYGLGPEQEEKLGREKYNEAKESLTVLLNVLCKDLLPEGTTDEGYPQHQEMREQIAHLWNESQDIRFVWESITND